MAYLALRFDVDAEAVELWSDALLDCGALSVDVADPGAGTSDETPLLPSRVARAMCAGRSRA
jgi:hypothetical protein